MRELTRRDLAMMDNVMKMLRQVVFRGIEFDEALGAGQAWAWLQGLKSDMTQSVLAIEEKKKIASTLTTAKEVKSVTVEKKPRKKASPPSTEMKS